MAKADQDQHSRALAILGRLQRKLVRRLTGFVVENETSLQNAADGAEGYGYTVHQIDELFLSRLNLVERAIAELQKLPAKGVSRYRTLCFLASRDEVEKEVNSRLEKMPEARILGISVGPAPSARVGAAGTASGTDTKEAPAAGQLASGSPPAGGSAGARLKAGRQPLRSSGRAAARSGGKAPAGAPGNPPDAAPAAPAAPGGQGGQGGLIVTVLYYGPAPSG